MLLKEKPRRLVLTAMFLLLEGVLYVTLLTSDSMLQVGSSYTSIVLCFLYALSFGKMGDGFVIGALACTVTADYFLVICSPREQLWGMVFFLGTQTLYAVKLQCAAKNKRLLWMRLALIVLIEFVTVAVLREHTDTLAVVSVCYYANLIWNIVEAFTQFRHNKLFGIALVLFLLCDTVIGLQVAAGGYLPIAEGSVLHRILFVDFPLAWFFYLPSQVLIALQAHKSKQEVSI